MLKLAQNTSISTEPIYKFQNNHSVEFDGSESIDLDEPISYTQHTISTWVKITNTGSSKIILDARDSSGDGIRIRTNASEQILYELNSHTLTTPLSYVGEWIHIVATYDGTTQKLFINSSLIDSTEVDEEITTITNAKIGTRNFDTPAVFFVGNIDEIGIWDRALSAEEIEEIYRIKYGANLVQNGRFDELSNELVSNPNFTMGADLIQNGSLDELGSELIPDGNFTSQSAVDFWSIATTDSEPRATKSLQDGFMRLTFVNVGTPPAANGSALFKSGIVTSGKSYRVTFRAKGTASVNFGSIGDNNSISSNPQYVISNPNLTTSFQDYEFYVPVTSTTFRLYLTGSIVAGQTLDITNISVKQVDPNDRWSLDTGWAYSNNGVTCSSANGTFQTNGLTLTDATFHKLTFDIVNYESGNLKVDLGNSATDATFTSAGSKTIFINSGGFRRPRFYGGAFRGTISNITVQEISGWSVSQYRGFAINNNGHLEINSSLVEDTGSITYASLSLSSSPFDIGKTYKVVITDLNVTSGAFELKYGRVHNSTPARPVITSADNGTYVEYFEAVNTADDITINNLGGTLATLSSISIKEVDPNDRWSFSTGSGWSYSDSVATNDGSGGRIFPTSNSWTNGVVIKFQIIVSGRTTGHIRVQNPAVSTYYKNNINTNGFHEFTFTTVDANGFVIEAVSGFDGSIDNIIVQQQKYVATNLKLKSGNYTPFAAGQSSGTFALKNYYRMGDGILDGFPLICDMMQPSLGSEVITNGDFATDSDWTKSDGATISGGKANFEGDGSTFVYINQSNIFTSSGSTYKVTADVVITSGLGLKFQDGANNENIGVATTSGSYTFYFTAGSNSTLVIGRRTGGTPFESSVDNVSVKKVNGVPGIMTNMSAGNITNDVPS